MSQKIIENYEDWLVLKAVLLDKGWHPWTFQYGTNSPEGYHVWFLKEGKKDVEVITHNVIIEKDIIKTKWI